MILNEIRNLNEADPNVKITRRNFTTGSVEGNALNQIENLKFQRGRNLKVYKRLVDKLIDYYSKNKSIKDIFYKFNSKEVAPAYYFYKEGGKGDAKIQKKFGMTGTQANEIMNDIISKLKKKGGFEVK